MEPSEGFECEAADDSENGANLRFSSHPYGGAGGAPTGESGRGSRLSSTPPQSGLSGSISAGRLTAFGAAVAQEHFEAVGSKHVATDVDNVLSIIELQNFEGWWTDATELANIMGIKKKDLLQKKEAYWITLVVIVFLEIKMDKEKETWDLVVCKARTWLEEKKFQVEALEVEARKVVQRRK